ncbi:MAG: phosphoribosylformylglycinamidine synthase [Bacteroidales bacterium]|jgi:phosphoribosylformylglycinamidine synthase|nr:phosphoribosylformylglycinamidine synthase [Bacteroidales bacterium]
MIHFFRNQFEEIIAVQSDDKLLPRDTAKLEWLFGAAVLPNTPVVEGWFVGPRREMITPWSTNAVDITLNMNIGGIARIERFLPTIPPKENAPRHCDPMLQEIYHRLDGDLFRIDRKPDPVRYIDDIAAYNLQEGLALSPEETAYLEGLRKKLGRALTDSEIFGFSQVNSEHCRHKIFNGRFVIDGQEKPFTLFELIKRTSRVHPGRIVSAYSDNCAFLEGPAVRRFVPENGDRPDFFTIRDEETVLSLKAETHNFPTTVEPFNGAATGSGGEIRDRLAGGKGAIPLAGTAVYMTSYPRFEETGRVWEQTIPPRRWLYQSPIDVLIKASNGASDFCNKFGQPLICGSLLTYEHAGGERQYGFDKVVMMAGGVGYARKSDSMKDVPARGDRVVLLGGDNYRIGMGGGAVSSVATGEYNNAIELNAVQRSNPEMQKRVANTIRALVESKRNPIVSVHDHGAGGHLNCLSELVEATGGVIDMSRLPVGDPTLSDREIAGNESQERMGLIVKEQDMDIVQRIAARERTPMYVIGEVTGDRRLTFLNPKTDEKPIDLMLEDMFGNTPGAVIVDASVKTVFEPLSCEKHRIREYVENVLQLEAVACKDWLTNKADRSVTGLVALQQTAGEIQLPLNNLGVVALDYLSMQGVATSIGHAPGAALLNVAAGSRLAVAEALTNLVWAQLDGGLRGVSLSANWMWPCRNAGEDALLYEAVEAASNFAVELGVNIPTGKDSLSMTQKYPGGETVLSPGTVIISTIAGVPDVRKVVRPVLVCEENTHILYVDLSGTPLALGGSSFAQVLGKTGDTPPDIADAAYFAKAFEAVQRLIGKEMIIAGHDVSAGGLITALLEMCFPNREGGLEADLTAVAAEAKDPRPDMIRLLFAENPALLLQIREEDSVKVRETFGEAGVKAYIIGKPVPKRIVRVFCDGEKHKFDVDQMRDLWFKTSYLLDCRQSSREKATERFSSYKFQHLEYCFPPHFKGSLAQYDILSDRVKPTGARAAIIREKGSQCDRETAWMLHLAGMDVKDVHTTDLIEGRETLDDVNMIVFVGGFSNSDVLGSAKGWAGALLYNEKARNAIERFYARPDTLSLGVCNGCQLMIELGLLTPGHERKPSMMHNDSRKFESAFVNVNIPENHSVMLHSLAGSRLGVWVAHGEGKFSFPLPLERYNIALKYSYETYPANPNGSPGGIAGIYSDDGRHLVMMPHPERSVYPWNWAHYPATRQHDRITPWVEAFVNAAEWIQKKTWRMEN